MNDKFLKLYNYLSSNNLTDLSQNDFYSAYSDPSKASEIYSYLSSKNMTDLDEQSFYSSYFGSAKKKEPTDSVGEPEKPITTSATADQKKETQRSAGSGLLNQLGKAAGGKKETIRGLVFDQEDKKREVSVGSIKKDIKRAAGVNDVGEGEMIIENYQPAMPELKTYSGLPGKEEETYRKNDQGDWQVEKSNPNSPVSYWDTVKDTNKVSELEKYFIGTDVDSEEFQSKNLDKFERQRILDEIDTDIMLKNEGEAVTALEKIFESSPKYKGLFTFEEYGPGYDAIKITNNKTGKSQAVALHSWMSPDRTQKELRVLKSNLEMAMYSLQKDEKLKRIKEIEEELPYSELVTPSLQNIDKVKELNKLKEEASELDAVARNYAGKSDDLLAATHGKYDMNNIKTEREIHRLEKKKLAEAVKESAEWYDQAQEMRNTGEISYEEYESEYAPKIAETRAKHEQSAQQLAEQEKALIAKNKDIEKAVVAYLSSEEDRGTLLGGVGMSAARGAAAPLSFILRAAGYNTGKDEAGDTFIDRFAEDFSPGIVTKEYLTSADRNMFEKAVFGITESVAASMVGSALMPYTGAGSILGLYAQSYENFRNELDTPEFNDVPVYDKILLSVAYGSVVGVLEKFGLSSVFAKTPAGKGAIGWIMKRTFENIPKKASAELIEMEVNKSVKAAIANKLLRVAKAGNIEGGTEATQELASILLKEGYNIAKGKDYFDSPKSFYEGFKQVKDNYMIGAIGGWVMNGASQSFSVINNGGFTDNNFDPAAYEILKRMSTDENLRDMFITHMNGRIAAGEVTKQEATEIVAEMDKSASIFRKIPSDLNYENKPKAFDLINERQRLEKEMEGMDKALVANKAARVAEINSELESLTKIEEDAVQEQITGIVPDAERAEGIQEAEISEEDAKKKIAETVGSVENKDVNTRWADWFLGENLDAKNNIAIDLMSDKDLRDAMMSNLYHLWKRENNSDISFKDFLNSEITLYRGETIRNKEKGDNVERGFSTYELTEEGASKFGDVYSETVKVKDLYGAVDMVGSEIEVLRKTSISPEIANNAIATYSNRGFDSELYEQYSDKDAGVIEDAILRMDDAKDYEGILSIMSDVLNKKPINIDKYAVQEQTTSKVPVQPEAKVGEEVEEGAPTPESEVTTEEGKAEELGKNEVTQDNVVEIRDQFDETQEREYNAVESVRRVLKAIPKVKVFVHKTTDEYNSGIANATGLSKESIDAETRKSKGEYIPSANEIHINLEAGANALTVFHEAFHAVVKAKGFNNADMKGFVAAVKRSGNLSPELNKQLDEFSSQYESGEVNEEFLSELVGNLASSAETMNRTQLQKLVDAINKLFSKIGLTPFSGRADRKQVIDFLNGVSQSLSQGREITESDVVNKVDKKDSVENTYVETNGVVGQTASNRKAQIVNTVVSENDLIDPATLEGRPLEIVYYDNFTSSNYNLTNRVSGKSIERKGEGGPGYSYRPEIKDAGVIAAFTNVTKGLNLIQGISSRNSVAGENAVIGVALQNKETGHLGNKTTLRDFYSPVDGEVARAVSDGIISEKDAVNMLKLAVSAYESTKKGQSDASSLGFSGKDFNSIQEFYDLMDNISFERRGTFNQIVIPTKSDLKITKSTKPHVKVWLNSGIPTLSDYYTSTTEAYTSEAKSHDIVKYLDPNLKKIGVSSSVKVTEAEKSRAKDMGVEIVSVDDNISHTSYPVVLFGENVGVPSTFHSVRDMAKDWNVPNPFFKAGRRKDTAQPVRIPKVEKKDAAPKVKPSRKKQISDDGKNKAIDDAKAKYELSKKRGNTEEQAIDAAINDLKKNDWYNNASDTERNSAVRGLEKQLGIKQKSAPSAGRILGKPKRETKTYGVNALRKEFIAAHNKAYREGVKSEKEARRNLAEFLKERIGKIKGIVKGDKLKTVINRALKMNLSNPEMADRFADYVIKLSKDAEYGEKLSKSNKLRSKIRKKLKQKDIQDNNKSLAKKFLSLDPKYSESIDEYLENAEKVLSSLEKTGIRRGALSIKQQANVDQVLEFIDKSIEYQNKVKMDMIELSFPELFESGAITSDMSPAEAMYIVENIDLEKTDKKISEKKLQEMRDRLSASIDAMATYLSDMIKSKQDPMTGENIVLTAEEIQNLKSLLKIDQNNLTLEEMFTFTDLLQNAAINQEISSVATFVEKINGRIEANKMYKENGRLDSKGSVVSSVVNPASGVTLITSQILGGINRAKEFLLKSGFNAIRDGKAQAIKIAREAVDQYDSMFAKKKANGEGFDSKFNRIERRMYSFLIRSVNGSKLQDAKEFTRRLKLIREQVQLFESEFADENMRRKAAKLREVADKLGIFEDGVTRDDIIARVDKVNADAVSFWIEKFAQYYPEMAEVSMSVYNRELSADINYIPDAYKRVITVLSTDVDKMAENASRNGAFGKYDTESTSLTVANRPNALPSEKFGEVRKTTMYIDMDFDSVVSNAFSEAMTDIKTAKPIRRFQGFINSASFQKMVANERNRRLMVNAMERYIRNTKGITASSREQNILGRSVNKIVSTISTLGGSVLLGGADQIIKQSVSMIANTVINSVYVGVNNGNFSASIGGLYLSAGKNAGFKFSMVPPLALVASKKYNQWLIDGMVDIKAFRGIESMGTIDQAKFKSQADSVLEKGLDNIKALPEAYVKLFLVTGDKMVAKSAFLMYYKKHLVKSGKSPVIDFSKPMDPKAKSYAMAQVSKQQGESDADMSSMLYSKDTSKSTRSAVKLLMPLSSFILNKKASIISDLSILLRKNADKQDRLSAVQSMSSSVAEVAIYSAVSIMLREMIITQIATAITGYDEEELDKDVNEAVKKENKLRKANEMEPMTDEEETAFRRIKLAEKKARQNEGMFITNLFKDLSPLPPFLEKYQLTSIDEGRKLMQEYTKSDEIEKAIKNQEKIDGKKMSDIKRKEFIANYIENNTTRLMIFDNDNNYGSFGFLGDQMSEDFELVKAERTGEIKTYDGKTKYLTNEQKEIARNLNYLLATSKVAPKDVRKVVMKSFRQLKKMALTADQLENYNSMKEMFGDKYTPQELVVMIKNDKKLSDKKKETYNQIIKEYDKKDIPDDLFQMIMNGKEISDIRVEIYRRTGVTAKR